jgi:hypothetical protein
MSDEFDDVPDQAVTHAAAQQPVGPRSARLGQWPKMIADAYSEATAPVRAKLLECLLRPVGTLGLVAIAAGAFGQFLHRGSPRQLNISLDDAARVTTEQVLELARYVEQSSPDTFQQIASLLVQHPVGIASISGSILLLARHAWRHRDASREP